MFDVLGIAPTRDSKAIRRAYAAALKLIDQQTEAEAFERLRAAYERAQEWAGRQADDTPPASAQAHTGAPVSPYPHPQPPSAPPEPPAVDFRLQQPQVKLRTQTDGSENSRRMARQRARAIDNWVQALMRAQDDQLPDLWRRMQADPALSHLDAADEVSAALLHALSQHPDGRMQLLKDATARFGWDRAVLQLQGRRATPHLVEQLDRERALWKCHQRAYRNTHERAIKLLRRKANPSWRVARRTIPHIHRLRSQVPLWFALQVPPGRQEAFYDAAMRVPRWAVMLDSVMAFVRRWWWFGLVAAVAAAGLLEEHNKAQRKQQAPAGTPAQALANPLNKNVDDRYRLRLQTSQPNGSRVYLIEDALAPSGLNFPRRLIVPPARYPAAANLKRHEGTVVIAVNVSIGGAINAWVARSSGSPDLDGAAMATLQRAYAEGEFPASGIVVEFPITFKLSDKK
ncbi:TonB family protein [Achromobacter spanius]|uniref:TonB family protein n=1 Tax=Achromobacter spanius TaxID=217203 RepID=UPI0032084ADA